MEELMKYNTDLVPMPRGLANDSHMHCYWNSTLQALLSCPQFIVEVEKLLPGREGTMVEAILLFARGQITNMALYRNYILTLGSIGKTKTQLLELVSNQQCVGETLTYFLEIFEHSIDIMRLFEHRYTQELICPDCQHVSRTSSTSIMFEVSPNNDLAKELWGGIDVIEDYKCERCDSRNKKIKQNKLTMLPEILAIVVKNYEWDQTGGKKQAVASDFPEYLNIDPLRYRAVAYIDHYGRIDFGHYISTCLRRNEQGTISWYNFNDDRITPTEYAPNANTYMAIYAYC